MTYNVFGGTLSVTQSTMAVAILSNCHSNALLYLGHLLTPELARMLSCSSLSLSLSLSLSRINFCNSLLSDAPTGKKTIHCQATTSQATLVIG